MKTPKTVNPTPVELPEPLARAMQATARPQCAISLARFRLWSGFDWGIDIRRVVSDGKLSAYIGEWTVARGFDKRTHKPLHNVPFDNGQLANLIRMRELFMLKIATALHPPIEAVAPAPANEPGECMHEWIINEYDDGEFCCECGAVR